MAEVTARLLWQNLVQLGGAIVGASAESGAQPARWIRDQLPSKRARTPAGWNVRTGFNEVIPFEEGGVGRLAFLPAGNSPSGAAHATAVQTAMNDAGEDPAAIAGLTLWLAADRIGLGNGAAISQWSDLSGGARHFVQATGAKQPTLALDAINGRPAVRFDGARVLEGNGFTWGSLVDGTGRGTIFVVFWVDADATASDVLLANGHASDIVDLFWNGSGLVARNYDGTLDQVQTALTVGQWNLGTWGKDALNIIVSLNDQDDAARAFVASGTTTAAALASTAVCLGASNSTPTNPLKGYVAEVIAYNSPLGEENRRRVTRYLVKKYGLTADATTAPAWGNTYAAAYDAATRKYTVSRSAGAATVTLKWTHGKYGGARSHGKDLGYDTSADDSGGTSYLADAATSQARAYFDVALPAAQSVTCAVAFGHNAGPGGTFTVEGTAFEQWWVSGAAPGTTQALSGDSKVRAAYFAQQTFRYWRILIEDTGNPDGFTELGVWDLVNYFQPATSYEPGFDISGDELSTVDESDHGAPFWDERPTVEERTLVFPNQTAADRDQFLTIRDFVRNGRLFFIALDPQNDVAKLLYARAPGGIQIAHVENSLDLYRVAIRFRAVPP